MKKRGPKPKPTHLKLITGSKRVSAKTTEPKPQRSRPMPPEFLNDYAKVEWGRIVDELYALGCVSNIDRGALACVCQAYARWQHAEEVLADFAKANPTMRGLIVKTRKGAKGAGGNIIQNPLVGIANKAMADYMRYATEFGMTPSARSRIDAEAAQRAQDTDPADAYFA